MPGTEGNGAQGGAGAAAAGAGAAGAGGAGAPGAGAPPGGAAAGAGAPAAGAAGAAGAQGGQAGAGAQQQNGDAGKGWWETQGGKLELKPPDGMTIKPEFATKIEAWAGQHKLSADAVNAALPMLKEFSSAVQHEQVAAFEKTTKDWAEASPKEFGAKYADAKQDASAWVKQFGDKELTDAFEKFGFGYHPALFRAIAKTQAFIRERLSEDTSNVDGARPGSGNGAGKADRAGRLYDHPSSKGGQQKRAQ